MASEYWKWKYRDVRPEEKKPLTAREKRKNWWHYHKWHAAAALLLLAVAGDIAWNALSRTEPDYRIAYVGTNPLPDDTAAALEAASSPLGEDLNGDGQVVVSLRQYASGGGADAGAGAAAEVQLTADIMEGESYFFLLENPEQFQRAYRSLRRLDGSLPDVDDDSAEGTCLPWEACPALAGLELGEYSYELMGSTVTGSSRELVSRLYLARRGFWTERTAANLEGCEALWNRLTEGAIP